MKSNLLLEIVAVVGLAGMSSAQNYDRRIPDYNGYGPRERQSVPANMVNAEQLTRWMEGSTGSSMATVDQWCYAMTQLVGGYTCPAPESFGFTGRERNATVNARTFLNNLRGNQGWR